MRAALIAIMVLLLLLPTALFASRTMGIWFDYRATQAYSPPPHKTFVAYVYADNSDCYLNAVEFAVSPVPETIEYNGFSVPEGSMSIGDPVQGVEGVVGVSISYFPPLNGYYPGYNELCKLYFRLEGDWCWGDGGTIFQFPLAIVPHGETGLIQGACFQGGLINFIGMTSILCPEIPIGVKAQSWGAIKSLF